MSVRYRSQRRKKEVVVVIVKILPQGYLEGSRKPVMKASEYAGEHSNTRST
jgi:hypothetical protein